MPKAKEKKDSGTRRTQIIKFNKEAQDKIEDLVTVEEPLEIKIEYQKKSLWVERPLTTTMRTPGDDKALSYGFLYSENIIQSKDDVIGFQSSDNRVTIKLKPGCNIPDNLLNRNFVSAASCGLCGKAVFDAMNLGDSKPLALNEPLISEDVILSLEDAIRGEQKNFISTGGLHACALFSSQGKLITLHEDIGRHNALDKLIGDMLLKEQLNAEPYILMLSGRIGYEMVQKAVRANFPIIAAIGAPSSLAIEISDVFQQTLLGFIREKSFNIYAHPQRINSCNSDG